MAAQIMVRLDPSRTALIPVNELEGDTLAELGEVGGEFKAVLTQLRNPGFHKKGMALFRYLYRLWEPEFIASGHVPIRKDFEAFRENLTIKAGYFEQVFDLEGGFQLKAKSLRWDRMENIEFSRVYNSVINVGIDMVDNARHLTREQIDAAIDQLVRFG